MNIYYERNLPHWHPPGAELFWTWRLYGSLPRPPREWVALPAGKAFALMDRHLNAAAHGPVWLKDPRIAQLVVDTLRYGEAQLGLYELRAWVVMANHVHVVLLPHAPVARITRTLKGFTSLQANRILGRDGQAFWQPETYDHWVRGRDELGRIIQYVEGNPVKAGLVVRPEDWGWSSAVGQAGGLSYTKPSQT